MSKTSAIKRVSFSLVLPLAITLSAASYAAPDSEKTDAKTETPRASTKRLRVIMSTD